MTRRHAAWRIALVRHGHTAADLRGWHDAAAMQRWLEGYDRAGIYQHSRPPMSLAAMAADASIVSSDLPRAVHSAEQLARSGRVETTPLLREAPVAVPRLFGKRWPVHVWTMCIEFRWFAGVLLRRRPLPEDVRHRVEDAATLLEERARESPRVIAVTHGMFRQYLAAELLRRGWRPAHRWRSYTYWSVWSFKG